MPTSCARRRADAAAWEAGTLSRSTPNFTTGRSVTRPTPRAPRMSPRRAWIGVASSVSPFLSEDWTTSLLQATSHVEPDAFRGAEVVYRHPEPSGQLHVS